MRTRGIALAMVFALAGAATTACGTRVERSVSAPATNEIGSASSLGADQGLATSPDLSKGLGGSESAAIAPGGGPSASSSGPRSVVRSEPSTPTAAGLPTGKPGTAATGPQPAKATGNQAPGGEAVGGGPNTPAPGPVGVTEPRSPVRLGSVSTLSGPVGATLGGVVKGAQVWVRWINDRGGVNGHPVEFKVWDDGGDPARHRAQVQEAVERSHVIAFLSEAAVLTMEGSFDYINTKRIPVVGTDATPQFTDNQPMYFIQVAYGKAIVYLGAGTVARRAQKLGLKNFGTITCSEIQQCDAHQGWWHQYATELGLKSVYKGKASLVQPDFTAECLAARNAGVEILAMSMDANSVSRIAASCARQSYRPIFASLGPNLVHRYTEDPNLEGMILGANLLPYLANTNPAMIEFLDAMKKYAGGTTVGPSEAQGWVAGRLFEKAAATLPEPPTSAGILRGLWGIRNETLGGLTQPLTFSEGQPTSQDPSCGFDMVIEKGAWRSPDAFQIHCGTPH